MNIKDNRKKEEIQISKVSLLRPWFRYQDYMTPRVSPRLCYLARSRPPSGVSSVCEFPCCPGRDGVLNYWF